MLPARPVAWWIGDTGSANHIRDKREMSLKEQATVYRSDDKWLEAANGIVQANRVVDCKVQADPDGFTALVLDNCPNVLSIGRYVEDDDWSFRWIRGNCVLTSPDGTRKIIFKVNNYVPQVAADSSGKIISSVAETSSGEPSHVLAVSQMKPETIEKGQAHARSVEHLLWHYPKSKFCEACVRGELRASPAFRLDISDKQHVDHFADLVLCDHFYCRQFMGRSWYFR